MRLILNKKPDHMKTSNAERFRGGDGRRFLSGVCAAALAWGAAADERRFTYSYEPETLPQGATEFEQWVTLRAHRNQAVGQSDFRQWDFRQSVEYGVTDRYTVELYLNTRQQSFYDPGAGLGSSKFTFEGVSLENRFMVLNPADHAVGLTLYLEPRISGEEFELEEKIILGQRYGLWKWAFNLTHATEWADKFREVEGEVEASFGLARDFGKRWSIGLELRDHNELPEYSKWENTALFLGPTVGYRRERWWAALTVLPQIWGKNFDGDPDGDRHFELEGHERLNVRLVFGIGF